MFKKALLSTLICSLFVISVQVEAKKKRFFPKGCSDKSVAYNEDTVYLGTETLDRKFRVYVFTNITGDTVTLEHTPPPDVMANRLVSSLKPNRWSAIVVPEEYYPVQCKDSHSGYASSVRCEDVIRVCELAVSPVMASAQGEYWITENESNRWSLFRGIRSRGIYP